MSHSNMKNKIKYSDGEIGEVKIVEDFLPKPEDLVLKDETVKVTLALTKASVAFFKSQAEINHVPYQAMIKSLLDKYASQYDTNK